MAQGVQQLHLDLERGVGQLAEQLGLRDDLGGHEIQNDQVQRAHILVDGAVLRHDEDVFALQRGPRRELVRDSYGHEIPSYLFIYVIITEYHNGCLSARRIFVYHCRRGKDR